MLPVSYTHLWGIDPFPKHYESVAQAQWTTDEDYRKKYPFTIINGNRSYEFFHSENRQQKTMREFHPVPYVQVSKQTAEEYGLADGEWIWIENHVGRCKQCGKINPALQPQYLVAEHGWWFPKATATRPACSGRSTATSTTSPTPSRRGRAASAPRSRASSGASTRSRKATRCQANRSWKKAVSAQSRRAASAKEEALSLIHI